MRALPSKYCPSLLLCLTYHHQRFQVASAFLPSPASFATAFVQPSTPSFPTFSPTTKRWMTMTSDSVAPRANPLKVIHDLRVSELRTELSLRGLTMSGTKAVLVSRLTEALQSEESAPEESILKNDGGDIVAGSSSSGKGLGGIEKEVTKEHEGEAMMVEVKQTKKRGRTTSSDSGKGQKMKTGDEGEEGEGSGAVVVEKAVAEVTTTVVKKAGVKKPRPPVQRVTFARDPTPRLPLPVGKQLFKVVSWNVAGLRGLLKRENAGSKLVEYIGREKPDVLCLQETKLQTKDVDASVKALKDLLPRYTMTWFSCSEAKKGYSGTAILVADDSPLQVQGTRVGIGEPSGDKEGRAITVDFGTVQLINTYVPNAGESLQRLGYRTKTWDPAMFQYIRQLHEEGKAVLFCGDMNVADADIDFFNPEEPRMKKQAGTTPEERASFRSFLETGDVVDTFRWRHPEAKGVYTYWSQRAGNRPFNRGLRLDYFIASQALVVDGAGSEATPRLYDAFVADDEMVGLSDHAPVGVVLVV